MDKFVRHGDLLLERVTEIPKDAEEVKHSGSFVLAEGETTGHKHVITAVKPDTMKVLKTKDNVLFLDLEVPMPLKHNEHKEVEIPSGRWKLAFEQEHDYFEEESRQVID